MRNFLFFSAALFLMTACSEDKPKPLAAETETKKTTDLQQYVKQIEKKPQQTPGSISGSESHVGANPHDHLSVEQHIAVAMQHVQEGRFDEALDVITRAILERPGDPSLIGTRGSMLLAQNRVYDALVDLEKAVTLAPQSAELLINRSQAYRKFNRPEEAMADLNKAVSFKPRLVPARFNRGVLFYDKARYQEALADFNVCIEVAPQTAGPYFNRAVTRDAIGDKTGAINDMIKFIELSDNPDWNKVAQETMAEWEKNSEK